MARYECHCEIKGCYPFTCDEDDLFTKHTHRDDAGYLFILCHMHKALAVISDRAWHAESYQPEPKKNPWGYE